MPEAIAERPLSQLRGIGGAIQNFELQKTGSETPQIYRSRAFLRQTFGFGGARVEKTSDPMQLASDVDCRRLVLTAGNFSVLDVFDRNGVTGDPRQGFFNMAFMTHASWDFPSDARGYSWGGTAELYWDDWAVRIGRITPPQNPNQLQDDLRIWKFYGDQLELEHDHVLFGKPGAVRLLGYRNHVDTGRFDDAIAAFQTNPANERRRLREPRVLQLRLRRTSARRTSAASGDPTTSSGSASTSSSTSPTTRACSSARCTPTGRPRSTRTTPPTAPSPSAPWPRARRGAVPSTSRASASA